MLKEITLPYDSWWDVSNYPESGFYKIIEADGSHDTTVALVLKKVQMIFLVADYTEDIEKSINHVFQNYFKKELNSIESSKVKVEDTKSIISFDDVLKAIAVTQDPRMIKDLVK